MQKSLIIFSFISIVGIQCFGQSNEEQIKNVESFLMLDQEKFELLIKNDSIITEINKSIKVKDTTRLRRRVDSLLSGNYSIKDFMVILEVDRMYRGITLELDRRRIKEGIKIDSLDDIEIIIEDVERSLNESPYMQKSKPKKN